MLLRKSRRNRFPNRMARRRARLLLLMVLWNIILKLMLRRGLLGNLNSTILIMSLMISMRTCQMIRRSCFASLHLGIFLM
ncbi:hypothetical protein CsatB_028961 [Cannabis sativa]